MKILVVDDHPLIQQALAHALPTLHGAIDVVSAVDREQALTALARPRARVTGRDRASASESSRIGAEVHVRSRFRCQF
jgi:DNA-binding NarL/FixJ family response regulator